MDSFVIPMTRFALPAGIYEGFVHVKHQHFLVLVCIFLHIFGNQEELLLRNSLE